VRGVAFPADSPIDREMAALSTHDAPTSAVLGLTPDQLLTTTRAVRKRLDLGRPVDRKTVEQCLHLAFQAPSEENAQPYDWVLVDDTATKQAMADIYGLALHDYGVTVAKAAGGGPLPELVRLGVTVDIPSPNIKGIVTSAMYLRDHLHEVPVLVVPTVRGRFEAASIFEQATLWGSVLPAAWSFMLALRSRGMGSAWTTVHVRREREMADLLGIPYNDVTQAGLFPVAHTIGTDFRPGYRAAADSSIHWDHW